MDNNYHKRITRADQDIKQENSQKKTMLEMPAGVNFKIFVDEKTSSILYLIPKELEKFPEQLADNNFNYRKLKCEHVSGQQTICG